MDNSEINICLESSIRIERDAFITVECFSKTSKIQPKEIEDTSLEQISKLLTNIQDEIQLAYFKVGLYQSKLLEYLYLGTNNQHIANFNFLISKLHKLKVLTIEECYILPFMLCFC